MSDARGSELGDVVAQVKYRRFHVLWRVLGGVLAFLSIFAVLVSQGLSQVDEARGAWGALEVAAVPLAVLLVLALALWAHHRDDRLVVRARGVEQRIGRRRVSCSFENVVASRTWRDRDAAPSSIEVRLLDGATITFVVPPTGAATDAFLRALDAHHRARASEAFDRGRSIRFGDVEIDLARGIVRGTDVLAWSSLAEVSTTPHYVLLSERTRAGGKKDWMLLAPDARDDLDGLVSAIHLGRERSQSVATG